MEGDVEDREQRACPEDCLEHSQRPREQRMHPHWPHPVGGLSLVHGAAIGSHSILLLSITAARLRDLPLQHTLSVKIADLMSKPQGLSTSTAIPLAHKYG